MDTLAKPQQAGMTQKLQLWNLKVCFHNDYTNLLGDFDTLQEAMELWNDWGEKSGLSDEDDRCIIRINCLCDTYDRGRCFAMVRCRDVRSMFLVPTFELRVS